MYVNNHFIIHEYDENEKFKEKPQGENVQRK